MDQESVKTTSTTKKKNFPMADDGEKENSSTRNTDVMYMRLKRSLSSLSSLETKAMESSDSPTELVENDSSATSSSRQIYRFADDNELVEETRLMAETDDFVLNIEQASDKMSERCNNYDCCHFPDNKQQTNNENEE